MLVQQNGCMLKVDSVSDSINPVVKLQTGKSYSEEYASFQFKYRQIFETVFPFCMLMKDKTCSCVKRIFTIKTVRKI